jgi:hypothetical protein
MKDAEIYQNGEGLWVAESDGKSATASTPQDAYARLYELDSFPIDTPLDPITGVDWIDPYNI